MKPTLLTCTSRWLYVPCGSRMPAPAGRAPIATAAVPVTPTARPRHDECLGRQHLRTPPARARTHENAYGGSTAHSDYGGTTHTNVYGGTTSGQVGYGAYHTYPSRSDLLPPDYPTYPVYHPPVAGRRTTRPDATAAQPQPVLWLASPSARRSVVQQRRGERRTPTTPAWLPAAPTRPRQRRAPTTRGLPPEWPQRPPPRTSAESTTPRCPPGR